MSGEFARIGEQAVGSAENMGRQVMASAAKDGERVAGILDSTITNGISDAFKCPQVQPKGNIAAVEAEIRLGAVDAVRNCETVAAKAATTAEQVFSHADAKLVATDGQPINFRSTEPQGKPRAIVVLMQGTYGQPGYFDSMGEKFAASGIKSYSVGSRVESPASYTQHAQDLQDVVALARHENPGVPVTVMGVSLGAMIALDWSARFNAEHIPVVAMSPVVANQFLGFKDSLTVGAGLVSKWAAEKHVNTPFSAGVPLTTNPKAPRIADPESMTVPAGLFDDVAKMSAEVAAKGYKLKGPLFMPLAGDDEVAVNWVTKLYSHTIRSAEKTVRTFPGTAHDLSLETNHPGLVKSLTSWILKHS